MVIFVGSAYKKGKAREEGEEENKEKRKNKAGGGGESKVPTAITRSSITLLNFQGSGTSKTSRASWEVQGKEGRGLQFGPPFLLFLFFSKFLNLGHRFGTNLNMLAFFLKIHPFEIFHPIFG